MQVLLAILGGTVGATIVSGVFGLIMWKLNRKAAKEDKAEEKAEKKETDDDVLIENLIVGVRTLMYDRIKHLANSYLRRGWITSEELEDLISMHSVYHNELKGNGFLDSLMERVKSLPVKG